MVAGEGLQGWLLSEAAGSFPGSKAEPVSDGGSASMITYVRRGKKTAEKKTCSGERGGM